MLYADLANRAPGPKNLVSTAGLTEPLTAEVAASLVQGTSSVQVVFLMGSCPAVVGEPPAHVLLGSCVGVP